MEDRHTLSEPRVKSTNSLVWLVDIHRKGVKDPIDTIEISEETLPPRKKKGKVVWRLPSDHSRLPSFPVDERRRIMELFKERKKNRRKKGGKKTTATEAFSTNSSVCSAGSANDEKAPVSAADDDNGKAKGKGASVSNGCNGKKYDSASATLDQGKGVGDSNAKAVDDILTEDLNTSRSSSSKKKRKKKTMKRQLSISSPTGSSVCSKRQELDNNEKEVENIPTSTNATASIEQSPVKEETEMGQKQELLSPPPPGFNESMSSLALDDAPQNDSNGLQPSNESLSGGLTGLQAPIHPPFSPGSRCIIIPEQDRPMPPSMIKNQTLPHMPLSQPKTSLAVAAAKAFVDLYYRHITLGLSSELVMYYTLHAQKSISVGGAHSVVANRSNIMLQLQSLAKSVFFVRGVVSQDTFDGCGAHILVTGSVQTGEVLSQFAHTISLVPVPQHGPFSFQIHNDALSLLTSGDDVAQRATPVPQQTPPHPDSNPHGQDTHHQNGFHPRPPGLGL